MSQSVFVRRAESALLRAGLNAGNCEALQNPEYIDRQATAPSGSGSKLTAQFVALQRPLCYGWDIAAGLGNLGERIVTLPRFLEVKRLIYTTSLVGIALGEREITKAKLDLSELGRGCGFIWPILLGLPNLETFFNRATSFLKETLGRKFISALVDSFAFFLLDNAEILLRLA